MSRVVRLLLMALVLVVPALPVRAERLVSMVSRSEVSITSSFAGETLTLFGNIEPEAGATDLFVEGPFHIVITITGPLQDRMARRVSNNLGVWINTRQVPFASFPSYYRVLADTRLADITDPVTLAERRVPLSAQFEVPLGEGWWEAYAFGNELVRLMVQEGLFGLDEQGVVFRSETFYSAQVALPSDVVPGTFLARTYLFKDGKIIAQRSDGFTVRKTGFERFLGLAAEQQPLLYGLTAVLIALFTGWLGGVVFRR